MLLGNVCKIRTGKLDASAGSPKGKYPFFTCAQTPLKIDFYKYDCECVLVAGNCDLNVKYFNGKFEAYQRTYIIESLDKQQLDTKFLYYYLSSYIDNLKNKRAGGVIKFIKLGDLTSIEIPNLGLNEQIKCVHELETIEHRRMAEEDSLICYESLIKSRFNELFSSCNFTKEKLDSLTIKITDGSHNPPKGISKSNYIMASSQNIFDTLDLANVRYLSKEDFIIENKRTNIQEGDLLFTIVGTIGRSYVVKDEKMVFQRSVAVIKPKHNLINSIYLKYFLSSQDGMDQINKMAHGVAQKGIYLSDLKKILIKVPDIDKQNIFESFVSLIDKLKFNCQQRIKLYQELLDKKMDEYFG